MLARPATANSGAAVQTTPCDVGKGWREGLVAIQKQRLAPVEDCRKAMTGNDCWNSGKAKATQEAAALHAH
eukprot:scaffold195541_cov52-Prasinocladus_malaysianus.AAC.1